MKAGEAGLLLRKAREQAGLSQTELARRAGVAQSVVATYESGRREPAVSTLSRLIAATGHRLALGLEPVEEARPGLPDTRLGHRLRQRRAKVVAVAAGRGASNVRVFGSVARGDDSPDSDIDLLVDLASGTGLVTLAGLRRELADVLDARVDVVPADSLKPRVQHAVEREAIPL